MKTYEVINMSDHYTIQAEEFRDAVMACLLLGEGAYALQQIGGEENMPIFLFGSPEPWFKETFGQTVGEFMDASDGRRVATVLDSIVIGCREDYESALSAIEDQEKRKAFIDDWNDRKRSSMNDIGGRARQIAEIYRKPAKKKRKAKAQ